MSTFIGYLVLGISQGLIYGLLALGLVLVYKGSRVLNLAHPYFGLLCAFVAHWLTAEVGFLPFAKGSIARFCIAAPIALAIVGLNGWSLEHNLIRRLRGAPRLVGLVLTIALAQGTLGLVGILFNRTEAQFFRPRTLPPLFTAHVKAGDLVLAGGAIQVFIAVPLIALGLAAFFKYTRFGVAVRAAAENGESARLLGVSENRVASFTWVAGSVLAGISGLLITVHRGGLDITTLSTGFLVRALAAALIGGLTSLSGAIVGGMVVGLSETLLAWALTLFTPPQIVAEILKPELLGFLIVVAVLVFRPGGLFGEREETEDKVAFVPTLRELPARLRLTPVARWVSRFGLALGLLVALLASLVGGSRTNGVLVIVVTYAMVGVSLTVLMGFTGQISLGHWALVGVGAFATADLVGRVGLPLPLALPAVVVIGMLVSLVIGLPALRIRGLYLAVVTLAFGFFCEFTVFKTTFIAGSQAGARWSPPKYGPLDLSAASGRPLFFFAVALLLLTLWVVRNLARSRTGRAFFALRENEKAAATLGVDLTRAKLLAFAVSGGIAALAGSIHAMNNPIVLAASFPATTSLVLISVVMIGGIGSLQGAVYGAFLVAGLPSLLQYDKGQFGRYLVPFSTGILLLIVIVRVKGGAAGLVQDIRFRLVNMLVDLAETPANPPATADQ
jgi:ABC-type branched-subunit amino acid transport system permease subunit